MAGICTQAIGSISGMDYDTAMDEETTVSAEEAVAEIRRHSASYSDYVVECCNGEEREEYSSRDILLWLGY